MHVTKMADHSFVLFSDAEKTMHRSFLLCSFLVTGMYNLQLPPNRKLNLRLDGVQDTNDANVEPPVCG